MKYCFKTVEGKYPEIEEASFRPGNEPGFLDLIISLVLGYRKEAFYQGYARGAVDSIADMGKGEFEFDEQLSRFGAEKAWHKAEAKENEK
jgi:hypothetical protein